MIDWFSLVPCLNKALRYNFLLSLEITAVFEMCFHPSHIILNNVYMVIPICEISSLLDRNLALACRPSVSEKKRKENYIWLFTQEESTTFNHPAVAEVCPLASTLFVKGLI